MSGKLGSMLAKHDKHMRNCRVKRLPKTRRISAKQQKRAEAVWESFDLIAEVAFKDGPDRNLR
jgi:hypothetical protein